MIHFVALITLAHEGELGWDPTIQRERILEQAHSSPGESSLEPECKQVDTSQYQIAVHTSPIGDDECNPPIETVYQTTRIIFEHGADALRGRGTRVFKMH